MAVAPSIGTHPISMPVSSGQTATFSVTASGAAPLPLSFQWQKDGTPIPGATAASYTTPATTSADDGALYRVAVTNAAGGVLSKSALLTVVTGPVPTWTISADKKYLVSGGQPFFQQGDTAWEIITKTTRTETGTYLDDRKNRGVNTLLVELIRHYNQGVDREGNRPFSSVNDFTTTQDAYFLHAEWVIGQALKRGMLVYATPSYMGFNCGSEGWCAEMKANGVSKLTQYGAYVGQRFRNYPNIVWVNGGDYRPSTTGNPSEMDLVNAVANGIISGNNGKHLHTGHWSPGTSAADVPGLTWLNIDNTYNTTGLRSYTKSLSDWTRDQGVRPVFFIEGNYENEHSTSRHVLRAQMWEPVVSGSMGYLLGTNPLWFFGVAGDGDPYQSFGNGMFPNWMAALNSPATQDSTRLGRFFRSIAWHTLVPDTARTIITAGGTSGTDSYVLLSASADRRLAVAYYIRNLTATLNMTRFPGPVNATWFDPTNEVKTTVAGSPFPNTDSRSFTPPATNASGAPDWVLLLEVP